MSYQWWNNLSDGIKVIILYWMIFTPLLLLLWKYTQRKINE